MVPVEMIMRVWTISILVYLFVHGLWYSSDLHSEVKWEYVVMILSLTLIGGRARGGFCQQWFLDQRKREK